MGSRDSVSVVSTLSCELTEGLGPDAEAVDFLGATYEMLRAVLPCDAVWYSRLDFSAAHAESFGDVASPECAERVASVLRTGHQVQDYFDRPPEPPGGPGGPGPDGFGAPGPVVVVPPHLLDITRWILEASATLAGLLPVGGSGAHLAVTTHDHAAHRARRGTGWALVRSDDPFSPAEIDLAVTLQPVLSLLERAYTKPSCSLGRVAVSRSAAEVDAPQATPVGRPVAPVPAPVGTARALGGGDLDPVADAFRLTSRELEVLRLLCRGLTAQHIGHVLRISPRTVHKHLQNAYAKLGIHDRLQVADHVRRLGLG